MAVVSPVVVLDIILGSEEGDNMANKLPEMKTEQLSRWRNMEARSKN